MRKQASKDEGQMRVRRDRRVEVDRRERRE